MIESAKEDKDSIGGILTCICRNVPAGWGEPCFDKLEALLAHAMLSIPATKGLFFIYLFLFYLFYFYFIILFLFYYLIYYFYSFIFIFIFYFYLLFIIY